MSNALILPRRGFLIGALSGAIAAPFVVTRPNVLMQLKGELLDPWVLAFSHGQYETVIFGNVPRRRWQEVIDLPPDIRLSLFRAVWIVRKSQIRYPVNLSLRPEAAAKVTKKMASISR